MAASNSTSTLQHPIDCDRPGDRWSPAACLLWLLLCLPSFFGAKKCNSGSRRFTFTWLQSFILHLELSLAQIKKQAVIHYMVTTLADPVSRVPFPSESFRGILTMLDCTERHIRGVLGSRRRLKSGFVAHYWLSDARYSAHISSIASQVHRTQKQTQIKILRAKPISPKIFQRSLVMALNCVVHWFHWLQRNSISNEWYLEIFIIYSMEANMIICVYMLHIYINMYVSGYFEWSSKSWTPKGYL